MRRARHAGQLGGCCLTQGGGELGWAAGLLQRAQGSTGAAWAWRCRVWAFLVSAPSPLTSGPAPPPPALQERQTLEEAEGLLKQLGFKGSLFAAPAQPPQEGGQEGAPPSQ